MFKDKKRSIAIAVLVMILVFDGYLLFGKLLANIIIRGVHIRALAGETKTIDEDRARQEEYRRHKEELSEHVKRSISFFYRKEEIPEFLERISQMAKKSGVDILNIMPISEDESEDDQEALYKEMPIRVKAKCGYHELGKFLSDVETDSKFMRISGLEITHDAGDIWRHDVNLIVSTFIVFDGRVWEADEKHA